jgi:membrane-associated phospholipid phosphatase
MDAPSTTRTLAFRTAAALLVGVVLVLICYFFVDRPMAWFVHDHCCWSEEFWRWPPLVSEWMKNAAVLVMMPIVLWWAWKPGGRLQTILAALCAACLSATVLKQFLKWTAGRYWPETWKHQNPSLIGNGAYGFHPFHAGVAYESFPSGHAAVTCAMMAVLWVACPRWRWLWGLLGAVVCGALVGMNYHFVGDVIAGAILGSIAGVYTARWFRLSPSGLSSATRLSSGEEAPEEKPVTPDRARSALRPGGAAP